MAQLGVDLGTWSVAAILVDKDGSRRRIVPDPGTGQLWARSCVARSPDGGWLLGAAAERIRDIQPDLYRDDLKRLLRFDAPVYLGGAPYRLPELMAQIITRCVSEAREMTDEPIDRVALGIPVTFEGDRAEGMHTAARMAGFRRDQVDLVLEPVAAARGALGARPDDGTWLIFDLGGGTFDASLVSTSSSQVTVLDTAGDDQIGGFLIDDAIVEHLRNTHSLPAPTNDDDWEQSELHDAARSMKHQLGSADTAYARNPYRGTGRQLTLTQRELAALVAPVVDTALACCERLLAADTLTWNDLTAIIPTGGATRSPLIAQRLATLRRVHVVKAPPELITVHGLLASQVADHNPPIAPTSRSTSSSISRRAISASTVASLQVVQELTGHTGPVTGVHFLTNGTLLSLSQDCTARVWDSTAACRHVLTVGERPDIARSPDGNLLATTTKDDRTIHIWNLRSGTYRSLGSHTADLWDILFTPDGQFLVTASDDNVIRLWNSATGTITTVSGRRGIEFSPDGTLFVAEDADYSVNVWRPDGTKVCQLVDADGTLPGKFSPDGRTYLTREGGLFDKFLRFWDPLTGQHLRSFQLPEQVSEITFSPDGSLIATGDEGGNIGIWRTSTGDRVHWLAGACGWVHCVEFSPDGALLATSGDDHVAEIWNVATGTRRLKLTGHRDRVWEAHFSPDGTLLVTSSWDGTTRIWDSATGHCYHTLSGMGVLGTEGTLIATTGEDGVARLWGID